MLPEKGSRKLGTPSVKKIVRAFRAQPNPVWSLSLRKKTLVCLLAIRETNATPAEKVPDEGKQG